MITVSVASRRAFLVLASFSLILAACGSTPSGEGETIRLYTSVTQDTVDAVVAAFAEVEPDVTVDVFRAPTGELTSRIAAEVREGGVQADILWLTDPLSMQQYAVDGLLDEWTPENADAVPPEFQTKAFWGTRILNMVIVHGEGMEDPPTAWSDLYSETTGVVAIPDPGFAGSAFGALAAFGLSDDYGFAFYQSLSDAGAVQVRSPGDVLAGVAEGQYDAGMTLAKVVRDAVDKGSPISLVWPSDGAVAIYSPIATVADRSGGSGSEAFVDFVLSVSGQQAIAGTGWQPIRPDVDWPDSGPQLAIDWQVAFEQQDELLASYRAIFGG